MAHFCPWFLDTLEYDGCCRHFSLTEKVQDTHENLTPEQIDIVDSERKLRNSRRDRKTRGQDRTAYDQKNKREKALASKKFSCSLCNISFGATISLRTINSFRSTSTMLAGSSKLSKTPRSRNACPVILLHGNTTFSSCDYAAKT